MTARQLRHSAEPHRVRERVTDRPPAEHVAEVPVLPRERKSPHPRPRVTHGRVDRCVEIDRQVDPIVDALRHVDAKADVLDRQPA